MSLLNSSLQSVIKFIVFGLFVVGCSSSPVRSVSSERASYQGFVGRVLKGKSAADFASLSNDPERKIIFLMASDGLDTLSGLNEDQVLQKIGYTNEYVTDLRQRGYVFKLAVFEEQGAAFSATWENVFRLTEQTYPQLKNKLRKYYSRLKKIPFSEIQKQAPESFAQIEKVGKAHAHFIDEIKLEKIARPQLWQVRAFFYLRLHLNELYRGDGWTYDSKGVRGLREYVSLNRKIEELPQGQLLDF